MPGMNYRFELLAKGIPQTPMHLRLLLLLLVTIQKMTARPYC